MPKRMVQYMPRQIVKTEAVTIFPGTKNDVMLTVETEKMELVFNFEREKALKLACQLISKAVTKTDPLPLWIESLVKERTK